MGMAQNLASYRIATIDKNKDGKRVVEFLKKFFFVDEPLNQCLKLIEYPQTTCMELENYCLDTIAQGLSVMAVSRQDESRIIGACLNGAVVRNDRHKVAAADTEGPDQKKECSNPKFLKILELLDKVSEQTDIFGRYPHFRSVLDIRIISVDENHRGEGIAKALIKTTKEVAAARGLSGIRVDCTSHYSGLAFSKLPGFECINRLRYSDHVDPETGLPHFRPDSPHDSIDTYIYRLPQVEDAAAGTV